MRAMVLAAGLGLLAAPQLRTAAQPPVPSPAALAEVAGASKVPDDVDVTISIPDGEAIAPEGPAARAAQDAHDRLLGELGRVRSLLDAAATCDTDCPSR